MRIVAVDPGLKPGVVEIDGVSGRVRRASHRLEDWLFETPWDVSCVESQWYFGAKRRAGPGAARAVDVNDLLTLAFRAGFTLACIPADRCLRMPPKVWREPWGNLSKEQVQKKIALALTPEERKLFSSIPKARHGDVLDAIGIARGALRVAHTTRQFDWKL